MLLAIYVEEFQLPDCISAYNEAAQTADECT